MKPIQEIDPQNSPNSDSLTSHTYVGIDNGLTGAVAAYFPNGSWFLWPVAVQNTGREKQLDVNQSLSALRQIAARAGGIGQLTVACELAPVNPRFGAKSNFTCGRCGEFWRVLLTMKEISFVTVKAQTWQKNLFNGASAGDPKLFAENYVQNRFPGIVDAHSFNKSQRSGVVDAMCLAAWAMSNLKQPPIAATSPRRK